MTTMISELYEALIDAGATEEKAREAAVVLSQDADPAKDSDELLHDKVRAETAKVFVEIEKMRSTIARMEAETAKMQTENQWYPAIVASTVTLAIVAVTKLFL